MSEATAVTTAQSYERSGNLRVLDVMLSTVVLWNAAVAAPLLDLLGRSAEFFVAHRATRWTVVMLAGALSLVVPLLLAGATVAMYRLDARIGRYCHGVVVAFLSATLSLVVLNMLDAGGELGPWAVIAIAMIAGSAAGIAYLHLSLARSFVNFAAPAPLVVLVIFLVMSPASSIVLDGEAIDGDALLIDAPHPVTLVIFDEFPIASIMDADGGIDEHLFPNFARLAETSNWYRNAVTVDSHTRWAVPAILSGTRPSRETLPVSADHPRTVFTALGGGNPRYSLNVHETMTQLCPTSLCDEQLPSTRMGMSMWRDLGVVVAHLFAPPSWRASLPPIDNAWAGFDATGEAHDAGDFEWDADAILGGHDVDFRSFIRSVGASDRSLNFFHALLPHGPWRYLPTGIEYQAVVVAGRELPLWGGDEWLISQAYQRHLMQVAFVDTLLGELMDHLTAQGVFDETMLILAADHGVAFQAGRLVRGVERANLGELAAVPLFIKEPNQTSGRVDDRAAETTDILPTIFDALDVSSSWDLEGRSLLSDWDEDRLEHVITHGDDESLLFSADGQGRQDFAARKYEVFQSQEGSLDLFRLGPGPTIQLIGERIEALDVGPESSPHSVTLDEPERYRDVDVEEIPFPALVTGRVTRADQPRRLSIVAIAVDDRIEAVTRTFNRPGAGGFFSAMVPPEALLGNPRLDFYEVLGSGEGMVLRQLRDD